MARFRLIPRDEQFFEIFEQATAIAVSGADALQRMLNDIPMPRNIGSRLPISNTKGMP